MNNYSRPEAVNSMSVFSSMGCRRGGGMFCRYASGARLESGESSEDTELPGLRRRGGEALLLVSIGEVSTHVSGRLCGGSTSIGEFLRVGLAYDTYSSCE